jgi:DNA/RNA-binding domain of Phe-tRNA-synthetase-like protein
MNITISNTIKEKTPTFTIGVMTADVIVKDIMMDSLIKEHEDNINNTYDIKDIVQLPIIIDGRNAYKTYGKDPSRYRLAVESLYRRLSKGNTLYRINNIVDLGNILSIQTRKSVAVLDYNKIEGDVLIRLGRDDDQYEGIGRGPLNISNIPLYEDSIGPFGSTTSDTTRTMITDATTKILLFIISFSGDEQLDDDLRNAVELYKEYGFASNIDTYIVK